MNNETTTRAIWEILEKDSDRASTKHLKEYGTLKEKSLVFDIQQNFVSTTKFLSFIEYDLPKIMEGRSIIYRGVTEAKYRLFNKAQREFNSENQVDLNNSEIYHESIQEMIQNAREVSNEVLPKFFKNSGLKDSDLTVLSFLQHYGAPTPFMDWTTDFFISLYFAISSYDDEILANFKSLNSYEIEDYVSIYLIVEDNSLGMGTEFSRISEKSRSAVKYSTLKKKKIQYINESFRKNGKPIFALSNNLHIINQKGLFVYNNSWDMPIEEVFLDTWKFFYAFNKGNGHIVQRNPISCINIHKSICQDLRRLLKSKNINDETIYSDPKVLALKSIPKSFR